MNSEQSITKVHKRGRSGKGTHTRKQKHFWCTRTASISSHRCRKWTKKTLGSNIRPKAYKMGHTKVTFEKQTQTVFDEDKLGIYLSAEEMEKVKTVNDDHHESQSTKLKFNINILLTWTTTHTQYVKPNAAPATPIELFRKQLEGEFITTVPAITMAMTESAKI